MPNYHKFKCPECGQELDGIKTDNESKREDIYETVEEWRCLYWCLSGCGVETLWIEETSYIDAFDGEEYQILEIVANYWTSTKDELARAKGQPVETTPIGDDS